MILGRLDKDMGAGQALDGLEEIPLSASRKSQPMIRSTRPSPWLRPSVRGSSRVRTPRAAAPASLYGLSPTMRAFAADTPSLDFHVGKFD